MLVDHLLNIFNKNKNQDFMVWNDQVYTYKSLMYLILFSEEELILHGIGSGDVVLFQADFSPKSVATLLALLKMKCIIGLVSPKNAISKSTYAELTQAKFIIQITTNDNIHIEAANMACTHELFYALKENNSAGLVIFSSGSTGTPKAIVHDFNKLFSQFKNSKKKTRVIAFLLFDHIGGLNTLFYALFNSGCLITLNERTPMKVIEAIVKYKAEALTTTPTFLNLMLLADLSGKNLKSLRYINYSTEVMPLATLKKLRHVLPDVRLSQAYGSSEMGVLAVESKSSDSLYIKINEDTVNFRIIDNLLEIKTETSMLGYLNEDSPFTDDGWYKTGDMVISEEGFIKILGRKSEIINVGGEKVYPAEVEDILKKVPGIEDVTVYAEKNIFLGEIVSARIKIHSKEDIAELKARLNLFCRNNLPNYKIPQKIIFTNNILHSERFKKIRKFEEKMQ